MEISKNSKFYISPEEMVAKFKGRRNINILCFNKIMALMVEYPYRDGYNCMNYYFSAIFKDVVDINDGLLLCTYKFGFKNKNGDIIVKNFCFTNYYMSHDSFKTIWEQLISNEKTPIITFNNFSDKDYISYDGETFL